MEQSKHETSSRAEAADSTRTTALETDKTDSPGAFDALEDPGTAANGHLDNPCRLERLPAELRDQILLSAPDLATLRSLVHASPVLHAQYRRNRDAILCACAEREFDGFFIDAYACVKSRVRVLGSPRTNEIITHFLGRYRGWLSGSPAADVKSIYRGHLRWLAAFHTGVIRPLALRYSAWALTHLAQASSPPTDNQDVAATPMASKEQEVILSRSEQVRIFRALYRYETYYHLFGRNKGKREGVINIREINNLFFCSFDPWEAEAVGCIDLFIRHEYDDIFHRAKDDLDATNPRFKLEDGAIDPEPENPEPEGSFNLHEQSLAREDFFNGTVSRGLQLAARLLAVDDHETLITKLQRCLTRSHMTDDPIRSIMTCGVQWVRRRMSPNARDEAEQRRDRIEFVGDTMPPNGPPLAWVLLWGGTYANIYGELVPDTVRRWGYVMWDEHRWSESGAKSLLSRQWETEPELVQEMESLYGWRPSAS